MREHIACIIALSSCLACAPASPDAVPEASDARARVVPRTPSEPAFVGEDGNGLGDTPLRRPDRVAILALARSHDFGELDRWLTYFQERFESDPRKEQWAVDAFDAFSVTDPALGETLDAWVSSAPESFAAFAARGAWANAMGWAARGGKFIAETPNAQLAAMEAHHTRAVADLQRAIELRPRAIAAYGDLISITSTAGLDDPARRHLDAALATCPSCFNVRSAYLYSLQPRWGGSYEQMDAFTAALAPMIEVHPRLALLRGYAAMDRCKDDALSLAQRRAHCDDALRHGDHPQMLLTRARLARTTKRDDDARTDLDRALRIDPQFRAALVTRFYLRRDAGDLLGAGEDLAIAFQLDSSDSDIAEPVKWMIQKLRYEGDVRSKAGKYDEAMPYLELAATLAPGDNDLRQRQAWNAGQLGPDELARRVAARPNDFELRLLLDHALAKSKRFGEVVKSWDEYLARVPDDGRAHRERGGAKWHLRQHEAAIADTQRACDLGETQACADLPKMRARVPS